MYLGVSAVDRKHSIMTTRSRKVSADKKTRRMSQNDIVISLDMLRELTVCQTTDAPLATTVHMIDLQYSGGAENFRPTNSFSRCLQGSSSARRARSRTPGSHSPVTRHKPTAEASKDVHKMHVHDVGPRDMTSTGATSRESSARKSPRRLGERTHT